MGDVVYGPFPVSLPLDSDGCLDFAVMSDVQLRHAAALVARSVAGLSGLDLPGAADRVYAQMLEIREREKS